jgi:uncharacterized protein YdeI (YjbR/CyaY-like superfamily)
LEIAADIAQAFEADAEGREAFSRLAPSRQNEYLRRITEPKKPETRQRRIF